MNTEVIQHPDTRGDFTLPTAHASQSPTPADLLRIALSQNVDVDKLQKLMEMQQQWEANEARKAYVAAMARFKANPPQIVKDKHVSFGNTAYNHATLGNVCEVICAALGEHGFSHRWDIDQTDTNRITVTCTITHTQGHSERVKLTAAPDSSGQKNQIQQVASAVTYLQRYTLLSATGMATVEQDDDGRASGIPPADPQGDERKQRHDDACEQYGASVAAIKAAIEKDDAYTVAECWRELPGAAQRDLWLAPSKGGTFTTKQREYIKTKLPPIDKGDK